jgi:hypothetical protein
LACRAGLRGPKGRGPTFHDLRHYPDCRIIPRGQQWVGGLCFEQALDAG